MSDNLIITLNYAEPVELTALSRSLTRIGQRYAREAKLLDVDRASLYITRVREGSLIVDLAPLVALAGSAEAIPAMVNVTAEFVRNLKQLFEYFLGRGTRPDEITRRDCDDAREILQPIATQSDGLFNIQAQDESSVVVNININPVEANAVQNRAARERESMIAWEEDHFEGKIFYWQAADKDRTASDGHTPDRGVIEAIDKKARKIFFDDPTLKERLVSGPIFETGYIVDGEVLYAKERIQGYRITAVHDSFPLE